MKVCFFGIYLKDYPRNRVIVNGLKEHGVEIIECNSREKGLKKYWDLYKKHQKIKNDYDVMFVAFLGQGIMFLAKLLSKKKIIFDTFLSLYNTNVFDRKLYGAKSFRAKKDFFLDKYSCKLADVCLLDTNAHIDYFVETFKLPRDKFKRVVVGVDSQHYYPILKEKENESFTVHFHSFLVPFHGAMHIVEAAKILQDQDVIFNFVTRFDKKFEKIKTRVEELELRNIIFKEVVPPKELNNYINQADICLGVFGEELKRDLVIPNKVIEALACSKAVITAESKACQEFLKDKTHCLYCQPADAVDLATKILELKNDKELRRTISSNGYDLVRENFLPKIIGQQLLEIMK